MLTKAIKQRHMHAHAEGSSHRQKNAWKISRVADHTTRRVQDSLPTTHLHSGVFVLVWQATGEEASAAQTGIKQPHAYQDSAKQGDLSVL